MFHSPFLTHLLHRRLRTTASCLWLITFPHSTLLGAVTRLSYPETPGFPGCQPRQVSPCGPRASLHAHQPTCAANVAPFRYAPSAGLDPLSHSTRSHGHCLPCAVSWSPNLSGANRNGLGRRRELHPPAPFVAAPALLEACGFSVRSERDWRSRSCRFGEPA